MACFGALFRIGCTRWFGEIQFRFLRLETASVFLQSTVVNQEDEQDCQTDTERHYEPIGETELDPPDEWSGDAAHSVDQDIERVAAWAKVATRPGFALTTDPTKMLLKPEIDLELMDTVQFLHVDLAIMVCIQNPG